MKHDKFQFKCVHVQVSYETHDDGTKEDVLRYELKNEKPLLNDLGEQGFEIKAIYPHNHTPDDKRWYVFFLQREIK